MISKGHIFLLAFNDFNPAQQGEHRHHSGIASGQMSARPALSSEPPFRGRGAIYSTTKAYLSITNISQITNEYEAEYINNG